MGDDIHGPDTKPRMSSPKSSDFKPEKCPDQGGSYQELEKLGDFCEMTDGTRMQRLHERNYCKEYHKEKPSSDDILGSITKDTHGPPFENTSGPKRVM